MDDAREQLRRYLEQRRELGERELVLDDLSVEEVLRLIGALPRRTGPVAPERSIEIPGRVARPGDQSASQRSTAGPVSDWREALRAAGASPTAASPAEPAPAPPEPAHKGTGAKRAGAPEAFTRMATGDLGDLAPMGLAVGAASRELFGGVGPALESLADVAAAVATCTRCPLHSTAISPVPGEGSPQAALMLVGEAPGAREDETGRPFVGPAGQLLTKILAAIELTREDVFICNVIKHRPPANRNPRPEEITACSPYLVRQIELIRPRVILALGTFAAQTLLETTLSIGKLRGQIHRYYGVPLIVTYHPAALLRNGAWKRPTWEDVKLARRVLDRAVPGA
ncbi:MAG TPA: uracil-DNA glycosylase [Gemmatimonadaceae bacterium]|nr:uracil-DNA glycosylase [Gemmatimonadaceae bacterium]